MPDCRIDITPDDPALAIEPVYMPAGTAPQLFVVVDTEEEFDWSAPFSRTSTSVRAMRHIDRLQGLLERYRIMPTYVIDYPVATQPDGFSPLKELADGGRARIGAHLHPWVNPPFLEDISAKTSYGCRLGPALETEKIKVLQAKIAERFHRVPIVYKAGRYGFGPTTATALESLGFAVDVSINPRMNFSSDGGPSFERFDSLPFLFGRTKRMLEVPCTTDYTGIAGRRAGALHRWISRPALDRTHLVGVMARLGVVERVSLSPEVSTFGEMKKLTAALLRRGVRTFSFTLHSPSVEPGCTPYVGSAEDLRVFLYRIAAYCEFFLGEAGGVASTPEAFRDWLVARRATGAPGGSAGAKPRGSSLSGQESVINEGARALAAR